MKQTMLSVICFALLLSVFACGEDKPENNPDEKVVTTGTSTLALPSILSSRMVLQQNADVKIWGKATPKTRVTVTASWSEESVQTIVGTFGRWEVTLHTPAGSFKNYTINIKDSQKGSITIYEVLIGEVWMTAGQSNMEHPMRGFGSVETNNFQPVLNADNELLNADINSFRYFKDSYQLALTPQFDTKGGSWAISSSTASREFEAIAYFFGKRLSEKLNVPIGIIGCAYGGTRIESWMSPSAIAKFAPDDYKDATELGDKMHKSAPSNIYNGMVMPVMKYTIRGWLWYQGESNRDNFQAYARLMQEMVADWRRVKGDTENRLPFYYVQIAPFSSSDAISGAKLRAAQLDALQMIPNSGIVCASDVGDAATIHYPNKKVPAERLALWAAYYVYGDKSVNPMGPTFKSITVEGNKAVVSLDNADGLHVDGMSTVGFSTIAGSNGTFYPATVTIRADNRIEFSSASVTSPVTVRYCFSTWHVGSLFNGYGLPLFPFEASIK